MDESRQVEEEQDPDDSDFDAGSSAKKSKKKGKKRKAKESKKSSKKKKRRKANASEESENEAEQPEVEEDYTPKAKAKKTTKKAAAAAAEASPAPQQSNDDAPTVSEVCDNFGLNDVDLEYTDADYQNLTTYKLFQQTYRSRIQTANPKVPQPKLMMLLAAKWREFQAAAADNAENEQPEEEEEEEEEEEVEEVEEEKPRGRGRRSRAKKVVEEVSCLILQCSFFSNVKILITILRNILFKFLTLGIHDALFTSLDLSGVLFWKKNPGTRCFAKGRKQIFCTQSLFNNVKKDNFWIPFS